MNASIDIPQKRVADFCRRHHINRLALWETGTPDNGRAEAPINVLVEFDPDRIPGLAFFRHAAGIGADLQTRSGFEHAQTHQS